MKKTLRTGFMAAMLLATASNTNAQVNPCGTQEIMNQLYAANPQLLDDYNALFERCRQEETVDGQVRSVYTIPVVFHVIHEYGSENITDAMIYDQMEALNEDYRMLNHTVDQIAPAFQSVRADAMIEFRLATLDPFGNCTNGIEHIYSHQGNDADNYSKLNQWHRSRYLNIWVIKSFTQPGLLAYSQYPTATTGNLFYTDGVIMLSSTVGANLPAGSSGTLTHEIGHYLGLPHVWGSTNNPGVACGDDGIADTPYTEGSSFNCDLTDNSCTAGVVENVQNFMDYSNCKLMYTAGQVTFMRNVLQEETGGRNNLYTAENQHLTGIDVLPPPLCSPVADFSANRRNICEGETVTFSDASWRAGVTSFAWSFPGGSPATSTDANPVVTYPAGGHYSATLVASNAAGSSTKTFENIVYVAPNWAENIGPAEESFNDLSSMFWYTQNPEDNWAQFHVVNGVGKDGSKCYMLNNFKDVSEADPFTADWYYYNRLGGTKDYLISESYDLAGTTNVHVYFDYAYGTKATSLADITEELRVYSSRDCGKTWTLRETISADELITVGYVGNENFMPDNNSDWKTADFTYTTTAQDAKTRFRFEFVASDNSSNLFIDNFMITGTLGIEDNGTMTPISLSPNPVAAGSDIAVEVGQTAADMSLQLVDVNGAIVSTVLVSASNAMQTVMIPMNVSKGCYFLHATQGDAKITHRVIVF